MLLSMATSLLLASNWMPRCGAAWEQLQRISIVCKTKTFRRHSCHLRRKVGCRALCKIRNDDLASWFWPTLIWRRCWAISGESFFRGGNSFGGNQVDFGWNRFNQTIWTRNLSFLSKIIIRIASEMNHSLKKVWQAIRACVRNAIGEFQSKRYPNDFYSNRPVNHRP